MSYPINTSLFNKNVSNALSRRPELCGRASKEINYDEKIIVIEDSVFVRTDIFELLRGLGWEVDAFSSCEDFLCHHQHRPNCCIVLDIHFPGMGGLELLRRLSDLPHSAPVIVVSGTSGIDEAVRAMKSGALDFIEKPLPPDLLVASIRRALAHSRRSDACATARDAALDHLKGLTPRQAQIMALVLAGHPSKNIAADLGISQRTVENHRAAIMFRTGARSLPELARLAMSSQGSFDQ